MKNTKLNEYEQLIKARSTFNNLSGSAVHEISKSNVSIWEWNKQVEEWFEKVDKQCWDLVASMDEKEKAKAREIRQKYPISYTGITKEQFSQGERPSMWSTAFEP